MKFSETRRHQEDKPLTGAVENKHATTGADQTPGLLGVPSPSLGGPPAAGRQRVFVGTSGGVVACSLESVWSSAIAGVQGGACSRLSPPVPGPRGGRGHTCRTPPRACSVSNATSLSVSARLARNRQSAGWSWHPGWTARGTAGRFRRLEDSGEDHPAGKYVPNARSPSGRPHPVPLANNVDVPLAAHFCTVAPFGQWVQTHCP